MKNFKFKSQPGMNPIAVENEFKKNMAKAQALEVVLENERFEHNDDSVHIVMTGKPTLVSIDIKKDCYPSAIIDAMNLVLGQVHVFRDNMAKELIGGK